MAELNIVHILVVAIISMAIGGFWYSPLGFGKMWMAASGVSMPTNLTPEDKAKMKKEMGRLYAITFLGSLLFAYVMSYLVVALSLVTFMQGLRLGLLAWLGLLAPALLAPILWEKRPWNYFVVTSGYYLITFLLSAGILAAWS